MDVPVWLSSESPLLPSNIALISNTAISTVAALKGIIRLLCFISPRQEQRNMATRTARAWAESPHKVSGLEVLPSDQLPDSRKLNSRGSRRRSVERHGDKARAVGAVLGTLWVWVVPTHGVRDVAIDPVLCASDDFLAGNLAVHRGTAGSPSLALSIDNPARGARFHIVVRDVAAISCFVPEVVALDSFANGLAGDFDIVAFGVGLDDFVTCCGAGATVDGVAADGVGGDEGCEDGEGEG